MREDWIEIRLDDIFEIVTGNTPSKKNKDNYGNDIPFVKPPEVNNQIIKITADALSLIGKEKARILPINSILITCIGNLGRVGINKKEVAFNQQINAIKPLKYIEALFTFYQAQSVIFRNSLEKLSTSTTVALVNKSNFSTIKFRLFPLPIQRAIVAKIEALFSDLDNGIANLKKAQEQLKIYRQAVLKKAFEGELTKEWREKQSNLPTAEELLEQIKEERQKHYEKQMEEWKKAVKEWEKNGKEGKKPSKPKKLKELPPLTDKELKELKKLPKSWKWIKTAEVINTINNGYTPKSQFLSSNTGEIPFLKVYNLNFDGTLNYNKNPTFIPEKIHKKDLLRSICYPNDVLTNIVGPPLGKVSILPNKYSEWNINQAIVLFRPNNFILSKYISYFLQNPVTINWLEGTSKATAGQYNIKVSTCREIPMQYCSLAEQNQIVQEIETRLSVCDKVEQSISESLEKAKALRQSILKKAFEGKLLTEQEIEACKQEPDYEPASVLLEKIKAEKLAKEQEAKRSKKRARK